MIIRIIGNALSSHIQTRSSAMSQLGAEVHLVSQDYSEIPGVEVHVPPPFKAWKGIFRKFNSFRSPLFLKKIIDSVSADLTHIHFAFGYPAWIAYVFTRHALIVSTMGADILFKERKSSLLERTLTKFILNDADIVTVKTQHMAGVVQKLGVDPNKIIQVVWGVDTNFFRPKKNIKLREEFNIAEGSPVIFSPRSIQSIYNIKLLVEVFADLLTQSPNAILLLANGNPDSQYFQEVNALIDDLNIRPSIRFLGTVAHEKMPDIYSLSDLVISLAWLTEGLPQTLIESLACGTPCLLTRLNRYKEFALDGEGVRYVTLDKKIIQTELNILLNTPEQLKILGERGRTLVEKKADIKKESKRVMEVYTHLKGKRSQTPTRHRVLALLAIFGVITQKYISNFANRLTRKGRPAS